MVIVGDVHGCFNELQELLKKCAYDKNNTTLIFVGDLVNKGPYSAEVARFVKESGALCVRGNHDDAAIAVHLGLKSASESYNFIHYQSR